MNLRDVINTNFTVAKGTFAAVDSFLGSNVMGEDSKEDKEVEKVSLSSIGEGKQKRVSETVEIGVAAKIQLLYIFHQLNAKLNLKKQLKIHF